MPCSNQPAVAAVNIRAKLDFPLCIRKGRPVEKIDGQTPLQWNVLGLAIAQRPVDLFLGIQIGVQRIGSERKNLLDPDATMTQRARRPAKSGFSGRVVQVNVEAIWQFKLDPAERIAWARNLADLVGKLARRYCPPVDMQPMWITGRPVQQDHVLAHQIGLVALQL